MGQHKVKQAMKAEIKKMKEQSLCKVCGSHGPMLPPIKFKFPFFCKECGRIDFPIRAIQGKCYVLQDPPCTQIGQILLPDVAQEGDVFGTILTVGPGYYDNKKWHGVEWRPGDRVVFDNTVPWDMEVCNRKGDSYKVFVMGHLDCKARIYEYEVMEPMAFEELNILNRKVPNEKEKAHS